MCSWSLKKKRERTDNFVKSTIFRAGIENLSRFETTCFPRQQHDFSENAYLRECETRGMWNKKIDLRTNQLAQWEALPCPSAPERTPPCFQRGFRFVRELGPRALPVEQVYLISGLFRCESLQMCINVRTPKERKCRLLSQSGFRVVCRVGFTALCVVQVVFLSGGVELLFP